MRHRKLFVLGCGGFVGSHLLDHILTTRDESIEGWDVAFHKIAHHVDNDRLSLHQKYLDAETTLGELEPAIEDADAVISLAAICTPADYVASPVRTIRSNFIDAYKVVDLCAKHRKWLIHTSTCEVYGRTIASYVPGEGYPDAELFEQREDTTPLVLGPVTNHRWSYATAKMLFERYVLAHHLESGLPFTIVRPYNWFGPRMDFIPGRDGEGVPRVLACFISALLHGQPLQLVDGGHARRTITYVDDAIDALMLILDQPERSQNQIFNIGNRGAEITISELAHRMRQLAAEITGRRQFLHHPIEEISGERFYGRGYEDCDRRVPDIDKARAQLGWQPRTSLQETLRATLEHYFTVYADPRSAAGLSESGAVVAEPVP
jgi:UDP-apiose/xylose synthase